MLLVPKRKTGRKETNKKTASSAFPFRNYGCPEIVVVSIKSRVGTSKWSQKLKGFVIMWNVGEDNVSSMACNLLIFL